MQRIKLEVFKSFFEKNLTGNEIDFLITLSHLQDDRGIVYGIHYKEMMSETGMSAQAFYDCKRSLQEKGLIEAQKVQNDYDITLIGNDFTIYTDEDYRKGNVHYIKTNCKMFSHNNWKQLKPAQKLLAMDLLNISRASSQRTHRIGREKFIEKYANGINPDGTKRKGLLNICERTLQRYLKMLKLFFYVGIKDGMYWITLRNPFGDESLVKPQTETQVTYRHILKAACRRSKIGIAAALTEEAEGIIELLSLNRKKLMKNDVYIPEIFHRMLEVINEKIANKKKWKRYLKKTLFQKLLKEEYAIRY